MIWSSESIINSTIPLSWQINGVTNDQTMGFQCVSLSSGRPNIKLLGTSAVFYRRRPLGRILTCIFVDQQATFGANWIDS
jgi:hypothetical protein|tara:strand:+ start:1368 stop:1607 length:240 start_codon:yes stop_codon:yes gene_type:complete